MGGHTCGFSGLGGPLRVTGGVQVRCKEERIHGWDGLFWIMTVVSLATGWTRVCSGQLSGRSGTHSAAPLHSPTPASSQVGKPRPSWWGAEPCEKPDIRLQRLPLCVCVCSVCLNMQAFIVVKIHLSSKHTAQWPLVQCMGAAQPSPLPHSWTFSSPAKEPTSGPSHPLPAQATVRLLSALRLPALGVWYKRSHTVGGPLCRLLSLVMSQASSMLQLVSEFQCFLSQIIFHFMDRPH